MNTEQDKPYSFALIAPYSNLALLCRKMAADFPCRLQIWSEVYMEAAIPVALQAAEKLPDVILSRGATAAYIQSTVELPVVSLSTTALDLLRTLRPFMGQIRHVAFFTYGEAMLGAQLVAETLGLRLDEYIFHSTDEVRSHMLTARATGADMAVGGIAVVQAAAPLNLPALLLETGEGAVWQALSEATAIARVRRKEQQRQIRLTAILNTIAEGIMVTDEKDELILMNPTAERLLGINAQQALGKKAQELVPNTRTQRVLQSGRPEFAQIQDVGKISLITNRVPIVTDSTVLGVVCTFSDARHLQQTEQRLRGKLRPKGLQTRYSLDDILTANPAMIRLKELARQYAKADATVVLFGESGTGKELFAQGIHQAGKRAAEPFVAVNCAAIPEALLESELFGYEEGAFTGARRQGKAGLFELAHRGSLFLDEITELPLSMQARLLRVLQEREVMRVGGSQNIPVDIRIICASNRNLAEEVRAGRLRRDLFYRLNVLRLNIPPLRERKEDIPLLAYSFLCTHVSQPPERANFDASLADKLMQHAWPGNVRELGALMERLALASSLRDSSSWPELLHEVWEPEEDALSTEVFPFADKENVLLVPVEGSLKGMVRRLENDAIAHLLKRHGKDRDAVAAALGISKVSLWRKEQEGKGNSPSN